MQKFQFRLSTLLRLRSMRLAAEREKLAALQNEIARAEQALADIAAERAAAIAFVQNEASAGNTELRALAAYLLGYDARLTKLRQSLDSARLRAADQRQRVMAADRDERLLLKLRDKKLADWHAAADREIEALAQESWNAVNFNKN